MVTRKPRDKFPLWLHPRGQWCEKHQGQFFYFGTDRDEALKRFANEWEDMKEARAPRQKADATTVADLANAFLHANRQRVDSGELSSQMWAEYHRACKMMVDSFGRLRQVSDLKPADFGKLRLPGRVGRPLLLRRVAERAQIHQR